MRLLRFGFIIFGVLNALSLRAETKSQSVDLTNYTPTTYDICIHNLLLNGEDTLTVGEIRKQCEATKASEQPLSQRRVSEVLTEKNPFVLTPHRLNYVMLGHYISSVNQQPFQEQSPNKTLSFKDTEVQFQFSFKVPVAKKVIYDSVDIYAAYTNRSFWQAFDQKDSIPFRETNHEPEI